MEKDGLRFESETTWDDVWHAWFEREGSREDWQRVAKEKGWQSWKEWRDAWVSNIHAQTRQWFRYTILNPLETVPKFLVGPTQSWQQHFPENERNRHTFATLVERVTYDTNGKVQGILNHFPESTEFIGMIKPDGQIVMIEGHHRAAAIAIAVQQEKKLSFQHLPTIALSPLEMGEEADLDIMLARGSTKQHST